MSWNPIQYLTFAAPRLHSAIDLPARTDGRTRAPAPLPEPLRDSGVTPVPFKRLFILAHR